MISRLSRQLAGRILCSTISIGITAFSAYGDESIAVYPDHIQIGSSSQAHRVIVVATDETGTTRDVSQQAKFDLANHTLAQVDGNVVRPLHDGETILNVSVGETTVPVPVTISGITQRPPTSFKLDVMPVFAKAGCNTGTCHGASRGQDGFRLSLFGFDPDGDYRRITREMGARRLNLALPESSLLLEKSLAAVPHTGGKRFEADSDYYRTLYGWIREGAKQDAEDVVTVERLELFPPEAVLQGMNQSQQLLVLAHYSDRSTRDVTQLAVFLSREESVAPVSADGLVATGQRGESFLTARFDAYTVGVPVVVLPKQTSFEPAAVEGNFVDELIQQKLTKLQFQPAPVSSDEEFLRRVSLDVVGQLPTPDQLDSFLADVDENKRAKIIDQLLARPEFNDLWANTWADLLLVKATQRVSNKSAFRYFEWLRGEIAKGTRWDEVVQQLLTASGGTFDTPATGFYAAEVDKLKIAENVAQAFLGIRTQCAQCHNHPFDRWTMDDYYGFAAFFARVGRKRAEDDREWIIFPGGGKTKHPVSGRPVGPKYLGGERVENAPGDPRKLIADWITSPENPYFAKNIANRLWAQFFGRGIVDQVDDVRISNPPVNGPLYEQLAQKLVEYEFDIRKLASDILNSHAYQRTAMFDGDLALERNFGQAGFRRISASILLDCIDQVTAVPTDHAAVPAGTRAVQLPSEAANNYFLTTFGRSSRTSVCACETKSEPTLSQALHMINGENVHGKIQKGEIVKQWLADKVEPTAVIDKIYLSCLTRQPTDEERTRLLATLKSATDVQQGLEDVFWAVLNSREFLFNH